MRFHRHYTHASPAIEDQIKWKVVDAKITDANGAVIFEMKGVEVPEHWSQQATNILAQKYFRKAGVPSILIAHMTEHPNLPHWLVPRIAKPGCDFGPETSAKSVFNRLAGCWTYWGFKHRYFEDEAQAQVFYDETYWMLAHQIAAPNSPQWFNTGLFWSYGIIGPSSGQWYVDYEGDSQTPPGAIYQTTNSYENPQCHACFIQPVRDDLVNEGGIMDLWTREVRLFKYGSGTGSNFSNIRGKNEKLSGGGISSGLMSFLKIGDAAAGAIKSGGVTRRAAKMVVLDLDHPEIEDFINWKVKEENKARALVAAGYTEAEALETISAQNANNSVRVTDLFLNAVEADANWSLYNRTDDSEAKTLRARDLWHQICRAAHLCGDPGVQFHDTINDWNTAAKDGTINASNPCGEYNFLDNTACNLASLNLVKFDPLDGDRIFDCDAFVHATRIWAVVLDISVQMASFPSFEIAEGSRNYRTLGLGYANLGGLLMRNAMAYDSATGRDFAAAITALMHATAYRTSAELATELGSFPRYEANREHVGRVINKHFKSMYRPCSGEADKIMSRARSQMIFGYPNGIRNAQVTLVAPTGTIALLMDCDTTGIEPDFALVKTKVLAGGGTMKIVNQGVAAALKKLQYSSSEIERILKYIELHGALAEDCEVKPEHRPIFACAVGPGALSPEAHVKMVASVQDFLSGGVSKTVNIPNSATVEDISNIYLLAHRLGLKSISVYRDGCKLSQPLSSAAIQNQPATQLLETLEAIWENPKLTTIFPNDSDVKVIFPRVSRIPLPSRRKGYTQKLRVGGISLYHRTGNYLDGSLGEIFETLSREGSTLRAVFESFSKAISIGLQFGVPLREYVEAFIHTQFEPNGIVVGHDHIKMCSSIVDLIFRDLGITYLDMTELASGGAMAPETQKEALPIISGSACPECGTLMLQTGTCSTCPNCQHNTGCA